MKKLLLAVALVLVLAVAGAGFYALRLVRSLDTPEFRLRVAKELSARIGADVKLDEMKISLLRGIRLQGLRVANPAGYAGHFVTAEEAAFSYRPWSLISGRVEVDEIKVGKPVVTLVSNASGTFNYEKLLASRAPAPAKAPGTAPAGGGGVPVPALRISRFAIDDARIAIVDHKNVAAFRMDDADLTASFGLEGGVAEGAGRADVASISLADALFLRGVKAPIKVSAESLSLKPLTARLAGGDVTGDIQVLLKPTVRYALRFEAKDADVATLLKEAGSLGTLAGRLGAKASFSGTGGLVSIKGDGRADIRDCRWPKAPIFGLLAGLLQLPELADPRLDECRVEFQVQGGQARTPVVSMKGPALQLTGEGSTNLLSGALDYRMNLALAPALLAKIPSGTVRAAFKARPDGFGAIDFKVSGTTTAPQTDLASSFGKSVAIEAAKSGISRLFGRKSK